MRKLTALKMSLSKGTPLSGGSFFYTRLSKKKKKEKEEAAPTIFILCVTACEDRFIADRRISTLVGLLRRASRRSTAAKDC